jgi:two-component system sensor histidine kinase DesK
MRNTLDSTTSRTSAVPEMRDHRWGKWVWLVYLALYPLPYLRNPPTTTELLVSFGAVALFLFIYVRTMHPKVGGNVIIVSSAVTALLSFALYPFGGLWGVFTIYACAFAAYIRPPRVAVLVVTTICAALLLFAWVIGMRWHEWIFILFMSVMVAVSSILFATLEENNRKLAESRETARQMTVVAERERIARDLHDLLGHTLTVVAVKADLAAKLLGRDPQRAAAEIDDIRSTARTALADIRAAVTGMRATTLAAEVAQARQALAAAGVTLNYSAAIDELPDHLEATLAYLVREGVTNVVRHAQAARCDIRIERDVDAVRLELRDDGAGGVTREGNGLRGMRARVEQYAGSLSITSDSGTRITIRMPLAAMAAS